MQAIEFQTYITDGVIEVPEEHRERFKQNVKVILLVEDDGSAESDMIDQLIANPLSADDFKPLSREEAHERG